MRARIVALPAAAALAAAVVLSACSTASPAGTTSPLHTTTGKTPHLRPGDHTVMAVEHGSGRSGSLTFTDPYAAGSKLQKAEYHLHDGYSKRVIIPGGAYVLAEDIAICGNAGERYPNIGFVGTGVQCHPFLHTTEVFYHQHVGDLIGRFRPHRDVEVTEVAHGDGQFLTVGHIDHGALISVEYYWANGEHLTVNLPGDVLIDHVTLITRGGRISATVTRNP
jgi:hypothetical protein